MAQGKGIHLQAEVFVDLLFFAGIDRMEPDGIVETAFIVADHVSNAFSQGFVGIDMEILGAVEQVKRREQSKQPVYMIAMDMTDEDVVDFTEPDFVPLELDLCSFTTIN